MWNVPVSIWNKNVHIIVWLKSFDFIMDNRVTWGKDMDDAVLFNGCIINQEIIFNANMNELRPLAGDGSASASMRLPPDACCCFCRIAAKSFHGMSSRRLYGKHGVVVSQNTFYQNISLLRKSLVKAGLSEDIIITVRQKGFSVVWIHWSFLSLMKSARIWTGWH